MAEQKLVKAVLHGIWQMQIVSVANIMQRTQFIHQDMYIY